MYLNCNECFSDFGDSQPTFTLSVLILCMNIRIICNHHKNHCWNCALGVQRSKKSRASFGFFADTVSIFMKFNAILLINIIGLISILCAISKDLFSAIIFIPPNFFPNRYDARKKKHSLSRLTLPKPIFVQTITKRKKYVPTLDAMNERKHITHTKKKRFVSVICRCPSFAPELEASLLMGESRK